MIHWKEIKSFKLFSAMKNGKGMSIVELVVVVGIMGILTFATTSIMRSGFQMFKIVEKSTSVQSTAHVIGIALNRAPTPTEITTNVKPCVQSLFVGGGPITTYSGTKIGNVDIRRGGVSLLNSTSQLPLAASVSGSSGAYSLPLIDPVTKQLRNYTYHATTLDIELPSASPGGSPQSLARIPLGIVVGPNPSQQVFDCSADPVSFPPLCALLGGQFDPTKTPQCLPSYLVVAKDWRDAANVDVLTKVPLNGTYTESHIFSKGIFRAGYPNGIQDVLTAWNLKTTGGLVAGRPSGGGFSIGEANGAQDPGIGFSVSAQPGAAISLTQYSAVLPDPVWGFQTWGNSPIHFTNVTGGSNNVFISMVPPPAPPAKGKVGIFTTAPQTQLDVNGQMHISYSVTGGDTNVAIPSTAPTPGFLIFGFPAKGVVPPYAVGMGKTPFEETGFGIQSPSVKPGNIGVMYFVRQPNAPRPIFIIKEKSGGDIHFTSHIPSAPTFPSIMTLSGPNRFIGIDGVHAAQAMLDVNGETRFAKPVTVGQDFNTINNIINAFSPNGGFFVGPSPDGYYVGLGQNGVAETGIGAATSADRLFTLYYSTLNPTPTMAIATRNDRDIFFGPGRQYVDGSGNTIDEWPFIIRGDTGRIGIGAGAWIPGPNEQLKVAGGGDLFIDGTSGSRCVFPGAGGAISCSSDQRLKTNIVEIKNPLEKILKIRGVSFEWNKASGNPGAPSIGVLAQEVEKQFPGAVVNPKEGGFKSVSYSSLIAPLIGAIKDLYQMIVELKTQIQALAKLFEKAGIQQNQINRNSENIEEALQALEDRQK